MRSTLSSKLTLAKYTIVFRDSKISKTIGYYAVFVILGLLAASLGPTISGLADQTQSRLNEISYLFTARSLGYLLGSLIIGRWFDRMAGHKVLATALLLSAGMAFLIPLTPLLWLLVAVMLLIGIGIGGLDVGGNTLLIWLYRNKVGPYMNALHFFFGLGAFVSPLIIARAVLVSGEIKWGYWILALLILPVVYWLLRIPSPEAPGTSEDGQDRWMNYQLVVMVAAFLFLYAGIEVGFAGWIFTFAVSQLNLSGISAAAYLTSAFWGALTLGRLLSIPFAARFRPRTILLADLVGCLFSLTIIIMWSDSVIAVWLATLALGLFMASIFPTTMTLAERRMPITGRVTGWFFVGAGAGAMTIPWIIGQLFEKIGPKVMIYALMVDLLLAVGLYVGLIILSSRTAEIYAQNE